MSEDSDLISYFIPSLAATLVDAEDKKGSPLDYDEVMAIRDNAPCIVVTRADAKAVDEKRGYTDLDPENLWHSWQLLRKDMGRAPDIDPGPSFIQIDSNSHDYQKTIRDARSSLPVFRAMLPPDGSPLFEAMIKLKIGEGENSAFLWLANTKRIGDGFVAQIFEIPKFLPNCNVGQSFTVGPDELVDWMVNVKGTLHGGFSLRYRRSQLSEKEQREFDAYVGVVDYA